MKRWVCPRCGSGTNAPERPRKNDVRRYCLRCSEATGLLVERSSPALERRRERSSALRAERAARKRERDKQARSVRVRDAAGQEFWLDVEQEVRRALRDVGCSRSKRVDLVVHRSRRERWGDSGTTATSGHAGVNHLTLTIPVPIAAYERLLFVIYHEAAHVAVPYAGHGERFHQRQRHALQKRWPFLRYGSTRTAGAYLKDAWLTEQLEQHVKEGGTLGVRHKVNQPTTGGNDGNH